MNFFEKNKILITGGAGLIGSAIIWALNQRGVDNILVTDFLGEDDKFKNLVPLRFCDYLEADHFLEQLKQKPKLFEDISCVFHLGACSSTTETNNRYLIENNFLYTKELAHWCLSKGIRFVYASSAATYGDGSRGMSDNIKDLYSLRPLNMYGYSKHLFDCYAQRNGMLGKIVGLKYFNVFGPNENHKNEMRSLVNKAFYQIQETGKVKLFKSHHSDYKDGEQKRDFLYVKDAAQMTLHLAESIESNGLFNIGSEQAHTWIDLVTPIFQSLHQPVQIEFVDMPEYLQSKYQYYTCANTDRLRKSHYTRPVTPLADAVTDYIQNYLCLDKHLEHE